MKTVMKKLLSLVLVAMLLVSAVPFQAAAAEATNYTVTLQLVLDNTDVSGQTISLTGPEGYVLSAAKIQEQAEAEWGYYQNVTRNFKRADPSGDITFDGNKTVYVYMNTAATHTHSYTESVTAPSCTAAGYTTYTCACGDEYTGNETSATGHSYADGVCSVCGVKDPSATVTPNTNGTLTVYVYAYNANNEAKQIGTLTFNEKSSYTLNKAFAEECFAACGINNFEEAQWQGASGLVDLSNGKNVEANLVADPIMTPGNKKIVNLKVVHNNGTSDCDYIEMLEGDNILDAIEAADLEITYKGYKLVGYSLNHTGNAEYAVNRYHTIGDEDMTVYCDWELIPETNKYDVTLRVYTNGDGVNVDRTFDMSGYGSVITRDEVKSVINKNYTAKSGYSLAYYGLFTNKTWDDGDYNMNDAVSSIEVNEDGKTVIYVMVKNVKVTEADTTNPKTGDMIFASLATMSTTAAAAFVMLSNKKRLVK